MRRGVWLLVLGVLAASSAAAAAYAGGTATTPTATGATTTMGVPTYTRLAPSYLPTGCVGAGVAAIAEPGHRVLALGTPASSAGPSAYPAVDPVVTVGSTTASGSRCRSSQVTLGSVALFGGFVTAGSVEATNGSGTVSGLEIDGSPVTLEPGDSTLLGSWGRLTFGETVGRLTAPLVVLLLERHDSLPAGTTIIVAFSARRADTSRVTPAPSSTTRAARRPTKAHRHAKLVPQPLAARPSLGYRASHYVFPVDGGASYGDTYGADRSDISDGWHHGDDLFAPLGTPVVAVANGTLSLVGWNRLGGWRLWLTDSKGNTFYYAHLAGYSSRILHHRSVRPGEVVGFVGRTGDAFTTEPHLHFEVHPHQYAGRGYDGAVDPTTYLQKWHVVRVPAQEIPLPAELKAPAGTPRQEAAVVWHELLVAQHLLPARWLAASGADVRRPFPAPSLAAAVVEALPPRIADFRQAAAHVTAPASMTPWIGGGVAGVIALVVLSAGAFTFRRRRGAGAEISR